MCVGGGVRPKAMRTPTAYLVIREQMLKPVLAGICHPQPSRLPKTSVLIFLEDANAPPRPDLFQEA